MVITNPKILLLLFFTLILPQFAFAGGGGDGGHTAITNIAICIVAAGIMGLIMKVLKQPLILGYLLTGVIIGPISPIGLPLITDHTEIITIAEIGLILLLFMIGLEIDLKKMLAAGKLVIIPGLLQFPLTVVAGFFLFKLLGISVLAEGYGYLYMGIGVGLASTMIVVKLLYDKSELDTLPGRITIGILIFQDIWAIISLAVQPNLANPQVLTILKTFAIGGVLIGTALLVSKYILPYVFRSIAKLPELVLVIALSWCFLICLVAASPMVGLSMEMGALIAGVTMATFPYNLDVIAKVISIRDFFITLFFVALGMQIPVPTGEVIIVALIIAVSVLVLRVLGVFGILYSIKGGHRTSLMCTINLGQISEFSLVIMTLGVSLGHIGQEVLTYAIWVFSLMAVSSTYMVNYSHGLQKFLSRILKGVGIKDIGGMDEEKKKKKDCPIVMLGFFRVANAFIDEITKRRQELCEKIMVVDFNPIVKQSLEKMGILCVYGDVSNPDTLHHADIHHAKIVISTISDTFLKGTSNEKLLTVIKEICPEAQIILSAESHAQAKTLYESGAHFVLQPSEGAGSGLVPTVQSAMNGNLEDLKTLAMEKIEKSQEILE